MDLNNYIGYCKKEVLKILNSQDIEYEIKEINENEFYDTELFVKFEYINDKLILYFDKFKLNI